MNSLHNVDFWKNNLSQESAKGVTHILFIKVDYLIIEGFPPQPHPLAVIKHQKQYLGDVCPRY